MIGLVFADESEAKGMYKKVMNRKQASGKFLVAPCLLNRISNF
jgi:hypothetical protein